MNKCRSLIPAPSLLPIRMNTWGIYKTFDEHVKEHKPNPLHRKAIKNFLYSIDWDKETGWKNRPFRSDDTLYDFDLSQWNHEKKQLTKSKERLQKQYDDILTKLGEEDEEKGAVVEEASASVSSEEDTATTEVAAVEASIVVENGRKQKGRPQQMCRRTRAEMAKREVAQSKGIKSALATVQTEIIEINNDLDALQKKIDCYTLYQQANVDLLKRLRNAEQRYKDTNDRQFLEQTLYFAWDIYMEKKRSWSNGDTCCKGNGDLCDTHYLPLNTRPKWEGKTVTLISKCSLGSPDTLDYSSDDGSAW